MSSKTRKNEDRGLLIRRKTNEGEARIFSPSTSHDVYSKYDNVPKLDGQKKSARVQKVDPDKRIARASGDYGDKSRAANNIPIDEANDSSFKGSEDRQKSTIKGINTVKKLQEIWGPKPYKGK